MRDKGTKRCWMVLTTTSGQARLKRRSGRGMGRWQNGLRAAKCLGTRAANFMPGRRRQNGQAPLFFRSDRSKAPERSATPRPDFTPGHLPQRHQLNLSPIRPTLEPEEIWRLFVSGSSGSQHGLRSDCCAAATKGPAGVWIRFCGDGFGEPASATPSLSTHIPLMEEGTPAAPPELQYGGYSRFELELEVG